MEFSREKENNKTPTIKTNSLQIITIRKTFTPRQPKAAFLAALSLVTRENFPMPQIIPAHNFDIIWRKLILLSQCVPFFQTQIGKYLHIWLVSLTELKIHNYDLSGCFLHFRPAISFLYLSPCLIDFSNLIHFWLYSLSRSASAVTIGLPGSYDINYCRRNMLILPKMT